MSALTLLVFRILADHPHYSLAADNLALGANLLDGCPYLHFSSQFSVLGSQFTAAGSGSYSERRTGN
jgi:hypothetical protein